MKLIYKVTLRLALVILPILLLWATVFYFSMVNEINDETDDSLEDYAEMIALRVVNGDELPSSSRHIFVSTRAGSVSRFCGMYTARSSYCFDGLYSSVDGRISTE